MILLSYNVFLQEQDRHTETPPADMYVWNQEGNEWSDQPHRSTSLAQVLTCTKEVAHCLDGSAVQQDPSTRVQGETDGRYGQPLGGDTPRLSTPLRIPVAGFTPELY